MELGLIFLVFVCIGVCIYIFIYRWGGVESLFWLWRLVRLKSVNLRGLFIIKNLRSRVLMISRVRVRDSICRCLIVFLGR